MELLNICDELSRSNGHSRAPSIGTGFSYDYGSSPGCTRARCEYCPMDPVTTMR
jgi:hypothetical protein